MYQGCVETKGGKENKTQIFFFNLLTYYISPNFLRVESLLYEASFNITHNLENVQIYHYVEKDQ